MLYLICLICLKIAYKYHAGKNTTAAPAVGSAQM